MKARAEMKKLPRLFDAHTKQKKLRLIFDWLKNYTDKIKQLKYLQSKIVHKDSKVLKKKFWELLRNAFEKNINLNSKEKSVHVMLKKKYLTLWTSVLNSRRRSHLT